MGRGLGDTWPAADTDDALRALDRTIRAVWGEERSTQIIEPSSFTQDNAVSVAEAVAEKGWPKVGEIKGATWFQLNVYGEKTCCNQAVKPEVLFDRSQIPNPTVALSRACFLDNYSWGAFFGRERPISSSVIYQNLEIILGTGVKMRSQ